MANKIETCIETTTNEMKKEKAEKAKWIETCDRFEMKLKPEP